MTTNTGLAAPPVGRVAFGLVGLTAVAGLVLSVVISIPAGSGPLEWLLLAPLSQLRFFTIMSNLIVAVTSFQLAFRADWTRTWHILRIAGVACIAITGIVFNILLAGAPLDGLAWLTNFLVHILTPILAFLAWAAFGPAATTLTRLLWSALIPVAWLSFTLVQGATTRWYPYPFLEAPRLGYGPVVITLAGIIVLYFVLGGLMWGVDVLRRRGHHLATRAVDGPTV